MDLMPVNGVDTEGSWEEEKERRQKRTGRYLRKQEVKQKEECRIGRGDHIRLSDCVESPEVARNHFFDEFAVNN